MQLGADEGTGERGVGVSVDQYPVRPLIDRNGLDAGQHRSGLHSVATRADLQVQVRRWNCELPEEQVRHRIVVVLARVDQELRVIASENARYRRRLDELRPR